MIFNSFLILVKKNDDIQLRRRSNRESNVHEKWFWGKHFHMHPREEKRKISENSELKIRVRVRIEYFALMQGEDWMNIL